MKIHLTRRMFSTGILPNPKPTQDITKLAERLDVLRLVFAAEHLGDLVSRSVKHDWNATQFLDELLRLEIKTLSTCQWIRECQGLLLQGPPGVGKTHLCVALGQRAIENGFRVCFARVDALMYQLKQDANLSPSRVKHKKYMTSNLLILDEFGYQSLDREQANMFFRLVNHRYQRGS